MSPAEAGRRAAANWPPLSERQVEAAARILAAVARERAHGSGAA